VLNHKFTTWYHINTNSAI